MKFYTYEDCGTVVAVMNGELCPEGKLTEIVPKTADGATEKHVPLVKIDGNAVTVTVGSTLHPMMEKHFIEWIALETDKGFHKIALAPDMAPVAEFVLPEGEKPLRAYEHCNLHGLWSVEI